MNQPALAGYLSGLVAQPLMKDPERRFDEVISLKGLDLLRHP
jgi:hypothetical protein